MNPDIFDILMIIAVAVGIGIAIFLYFLTIFRRPDTSISAKNSGFAEADFGDNQKNTSQSKSSDGSIRSEGELKIRFDRAKETAIKAELGNDSKSRFIAYMTHEIRSALNIIMGNSNLMLEDEAKTLTDKQREYIDTIVNSSKKLLSVTENIGEFSTKQKGAGHLQIHSKPFDLKKICEEIIHEEFPAAKSKKVNLEFVPDQNLPPFITGDSAKISNMLSTLIENAIRFTAEGHVRLEVKNLTPDRTDTITLRFMVEDTGKGIPEGEIEGLFDFTSDDVAKAERRGNVGLGLSICKYLAESMGGTVKAENGKSRGAVFILEIPFAIPTPETSAKTISVKQVKEEIKSQVNLKGKHALLIEDDPVNRQLEKIFLQRLGLDVDIAINGQEGLERFKLKKYDLVFMDCEMPIMDGYTATKEIRNFEAGKSRTPVIAMTAYALVGDREICIAAGMDDYISKPVNAKELSNIVSKCLQP